MYPVKGKSEKKRRKICDELQKYPYSFQMTDIGLVKSKAFESLRNDLTAKLGRKTGHSTTVQSALDRNLLAFVLFQLDDHEKALKETEEVLKMTDQQNNIVSLANKAYMLSMFNSFDKAQKVLDELKELQATPLFEYLLVKAKGELGASYLRFGPRFNKHAIDAFREILPQAKEPEVWIWKFCLAVAYRHALDLQHAPYVSHGKYTVTHEDTLKILQEIVRCKATGGEEAADANLKANAYAEMALLLRLTWDKTTEYQLCSQAETGPLACCKKALGLDDNDASVLWKSGKVYRNYKDVFKSRKLLEKAVLLQPSSAAYHHLGLTYKAMATNLRYGKLKTRRGGKRQKERRKAREEKMKSQKAEGGDAELVVSRPPVASAPGRETRKNERVERIKKAVKSPGDVTEFDSDEGNTKLAMDNLQLAIDFSEKENSRAAYDLALLYKAMNKLGDAVDLLKSIVQRQNSDIATPSGLLEQITSLDQLGLIYKQMAREEANDGARQKREKESESKMYGALHLLARLYSNIADVKDFLGEIIHSPSALLKAADASAQSDSFKRKIKAKIHSLINNHKQSHSLLADIAQQEQDAEYWKLKLETCSRAGEHEKAGAFLSWLKTNTEQFAEIIKLFEDQHDLHVLYDIYFKAGKQTLFHGPCDVGYFVEAFRQEVQLPAEQASFHPSSSTSDNDCTSMKGAAVKESEHSDSGHGKPWDIMLLYDEEDDNIEEKAVRLGDILEKACGLRVVRRDENFLPGVRVRTAIHQNIENSRLVVVLPGKEDRQAEFEEYVNMASMKQFVVLLTEGAGPEAIPRQLKTSSLRCMTCNEEIFDTGVHAAGPYTPQVIEAICQLFQFFAHHDQ